MAAARDGMPAFGSLACGAGVSTGLDGADAAGAAGGATGAAGRDGTGFGISRSCQFAIGSGL
jgi:hypothetical protein